MEVLEVQVTRDLAVMLEHPAHPGHLELKVTPDPREITAHLEVPELPE